ncbi:acetate--CoA ligase family protein [Shimia ponticola]|uniref:acetate--CoA ligase family protein n=1 Tax=Shimia ponticola TaxID=2582893 RepID=UPI0011BEF805|nr:acetate--CoA ligase family protein [Shimia ponticola]
MSRDLSRFLAPRSLAVIGGGAWCAAIVDAARRIGFSGTITPVHPTKTAVAGLPAVASIADLPEPPDAAFIGVNRHATIEVVKDLRAAGAGGGICFASGFSEAVAEDDSAGDLQAALVDAAGDMPILGPNCYGFLNALEPSGLWPDQHGLVPVERGVAILSQSSNIAINLTMQHRGLPIAFVATLGNQAQTTQAGLAHHLLDDPRITALGFYVEGFGDLRAWEALAQKAHARGIPLVALKSGRSEQAQAATVSHTASLAGADAGAQAFMERLGIARVRSIPAFLEALKLGHMFGRLPDARIATISSSGGEASLAADTAHGSRVTFPALTAPQETALRDALGPMVALANPLDYHTYIWRNEAAMTRAWSAMADPGIDLIGLILDYPRADRCDPVDWEIATRAAIGAAAQTGARYALVASMPELLPEATARHLMDHGVLPLHGLDHAIEAIEAMSGDVPDAQPPVALSGSDAETEEFTEAAAKDALRRFGLSAPKGDFATKATAVDVAQAVGFPVAIKVQGLAHKTGAGGLALGLTSVEEVQAALSELADGPLWIEQMIPAPLVELLVGITRDPAHGFLLTLAAGGTLTELLDDSQTLLLPAPRASVEQALFKLKLAPRLTGYRGSPPVDLTATLDAIDAIQAYALDNSATLHELEVNPLILTQDAAIAADALIRKAPDVPD